MTGLIPVAGVLAGMVSIADTIPYIRDTLRGTTRPHRGTWMIWALLAILACSSQGAGGATWSLIMAATQAVLTSLIVVLALGRGEGGMGAGDALMIAVAGAGVGGWAATDEPIVATGCVVGADLVAAVMMVPKTYRDPGSETLSTFVLASVAGALAAAAVGAPDLALLLYPIYYCVVNGAIALLIYLRRVALRSAAADGAPAAKGQILRT